MTAAAGLSSASATRPASAARNPPESGGEEISRSDSSELAAFAELFPELKSEDELSGEPAAAKDDPAPDDSAEPLAALTLEMTHRRWFGEDGPPPPPDEGIQRRNGSVLTLPKADEGSAPSAQMPATPMPPFGVSGWFDPQPADGRAGAQPAASADVRVERLDARSWENPASAARLREIAETLAKVQTAGEAPAAPPASTPVPVPAAAGPDTCPARPSQHTPAESQCEPLRAGIRSSQGRIVGRRTRANEEWPSARSRHDEGRAHRRHPTRSGRLALAGHADHRPDRQRYSRRRAAGGTAAGGTVAHRQFANARAAHSARSRSVRPAHHPPIAQGRCAQSPT